MSYEIKPQNLKTFIEDKSIKLPRFQRKQTWTEKKNFLLALSVFKGYPVGVCILNVEIINGVRSKWLLDGRQRRNALSQMSEDPELIYYWAKKYIGFKNSDQLHDIEEQFELKISEYIEEDIDDSEDFEEEIQEDATAQIDEVEEIQGIDLLLNIIKACHNISSNSSGFTRPFNFSEHFDNLPYLVNRESVGKKLDSRRLRYFILQYQVFCNLEDLKYNHPESLIKYYHEKLVINGADKKEKFRLEVLKKWAQILERIEIIYKIDSLLQSSEIGLIEVSNITSTDSQKIFNIINTGGSLLTAAEILSAKPIWNLKVVNPVQKTIENKDSLYKTIGIEFENVVRWDVPAITIKRFENLEIFIPKYDENFIERQINLGFKLLAGQFIGGIKKEDINSLGGHKIIESVSVFEDYISHMNNMLKIINDTSFFKFIKSWGKSMLEILSEAVTLNFLILMYKNYEKRNYPLTGIEVKKFQRDAISLFDKMVFEYVKKSWRGSSDSKIARNIANFDLETTFKSTSNDNWKDLLLEIFDNNRIDDQFIDQGSVTPLVYHYYFLSSLSGPVDSDSIDVDHIIPRSLFEASSLENRIAISNNLYNLELLPKKENCSKNSKKLNQIDDNWLKQQITKYSGIPEERFNEFSTLNTNSLNELKKMRVEKYLMAFSSSRENILNNL